MQIRLAQMEDIQDINSLLYQVAAVHHNGRPDLFKAGAKKYNDEELADIIDNKDTPIFVAESEGRVVGYCFCVISQIQSHVLTNIKTLYIDDLCVDENVRGQKIGQRLYAFVREYAKHEGCYNITLNVWSCNPLAQHFYEKLGLVPQKVGMEEIL